MEEKNCGFTHLHVHTEYSLLDGAAHIKGENGIVARAKELGFTSLAITDHGTMYGCLEFFLECKERGIKPIIGCEVYVAPDSRFSKQGTSDSDDRYNHLVLLVKNDVGYRNLCKIVTAGFTEGFYYKPRVDLEVLKEYSEGLICLSACIAGAVPSLILKGKYDEALSLAKKYQDIFGKENYFLEIQNHGLREEQEVVVPLMNIAREIGAGMVVTNDSHYTLKEDADAHDILLCLQTQRKKKDENRMKFNAPEYYLKSEEEMRELFPSIPEAYENTNKIAEMCNFEYELDNVKLPVYEQPAPFKSSYDYFRHLCLEGLKTRYGNPVPSEILDKVEYELSIIYKMGYIDYFLIVWDFINFAKSNDIPVGPGRGSGAGSICAYAVGITNIDPIKYELFFERFLNPERVSMPDFDIDFCFNRVGEVEEYIIQKYGKERVSHVITFQTMATRASIKDTGRVLDYSYAECDKLSKMIPNDASTLTDALSKNPELKNLYDTDERVKYLFDIARKIEGTPKAASQHAAGVLICDKPIVEYAPMMTAEGVQVIQARKEEVERLGLLKFDLLKLRTLTAIDNTLKTLRKQRGINIDIDKIDMADPKVFKNLSTGKMYSVFQFDSAGMKGILAQLHPESVEDLTAVISLYRPGPMDSIPRYIRNKFHPEEVTYYHPIVQKTLEPTYGVIVYQEQIMRICQDMAGFTLGRADEVRRAMSKKKEALMKKQFKAFKYGDKDADGNVTCEGALAKGISEEICDIVLSDMTDFSKYAFNKAHAACYAVVAYQTAYLITYYPVEYFAAYLTSFLSDNKNLKKRCYEVKKEAGMNILPPDINYSATDFISQNNNIVFGLGALSGIGSATTQKIEAERDANGPFVSLFDFMNRMSKVTSIDKKWLDALIKSGCLDSIAEGHNRNELLAVYPLYQQYLANENASSSNGQISLFDFLGEEAKNATIPAIPSLPDLDPDVKLQYEKEIAYMYLSQHPLETYRKWITGINTDEISNITENLEKDTPEYQVGTKVIFPAIITGDISKKMTKKNTNVWFFTLSDEGEDIDAVGFDKFVNQYGYILENEKCYMFKGTLDLRDENWQIILDEAIPFPTNNGEIDSFLGKLQVQNKRQPTYHQSQKNVEQPKTVQQTEYAHGIHILVPNLSYAETNLFELLNNMPGNYPVIMYFSDTKNAGKYPKAININSPLMRQLVDTVGMQNVKWF